MFDGRITGYYESAGFESELFKETKYCIKKMKAKGYKMGGFLRSFLACLMLVFVMGLQGCGGKQAGESPSGGGRGTSGSSGMAAASARVGTAAGASAAPAGFPDTARLASSPSSALPGPVPSGSSPVGTAPARPQPPYPSLGRHNAWGGSSASGLDMEVFGPGGTVVFRNPSFPLGDVPLRKQESSSTPVSQAQERQPS